MWIRAGGGGVRALGRASAPPVTAIDKDVLAVRETAWRAWFAGDEKMLGDLLPEEFIAIDAHGYEMSDRAKALASSRAFKAAGGRLVSLSFSDNRAQRYGDTVILYCRYDAVIETSKGREPMSGRATEISSAAMDGGFIRGGIWMCNPKQSVVGSRRSLVAVGCQSIVRSRSSQRLTTDCRLRQRLATDRPPRPSQPRDEDQPNHSP